MDEKEETKEEKSKTTEEDTGKGDKPQMPALIEQANTAAERLELANKKREEILQRQEELMAHQRLGGYSEAGMHEQKKEETAEEYSDRVLKGEVNLFTEK